MFARIRKALKSRDEGFTLIELLVVVIIIGILAAIAIPIFLNQKGSAYDATVQDDLKNYTGAAENYYVNNSAYAASSDTFANGAATPLGSKGNSFAAFVSTTAGQPGWVVYGKNANSDKVWVISSFSGSRPRADVTAITAIASATVTTAATDDGTTATVAYSAAGTWTAP